MKCGVANCSDNAVIHIQTIKGRKKVDEFHVCGVHSWSCAPFSEPNREPAIGCQQKQKGTALFDLEAIVSFDEFSRAGIYLREVGGVQRFSLHCGYVELTYLWDLVKNPPPDRPFTHGGNGLGNSGSRRCTSGCLD